MDFNTAVADIGAVAAVVAAVAAVVGVVLGVRQLRLTKEYRHEDAEAAQRLREQEAATLRSTLRAHFQSMERQIPNVTVPAHVHVSWAAFSEDQMRPLRGIEQSLNKLSVLGENVQRAVRDAYAACMKLGVPYTRTSPPRDDVLQAKAAVTAVLSLL